MERIGDAAAVVDDDAGIEEGRAVISCVRRREHPCRLSWMCVLRCQWLWCGDAPGPVIVAVVCVLMVHWQPVAGMRV